MSPRRALMIVDLQRAFEPPAPFVEKLRRYSRRFTCRVFTRYVNPPGSNFRRLLKQNCCAPGSSDVELLVSPSLGDIVIEKSTYGLSPAHVQRLRRRRIRRLIVCGLDTDACVLAVMFSLFDAGIECHLKEDMCWSSSGLNKFALKIAREQFPPPR